MSKVNVEMGAVLGRVVVQVILAQALWETLFVIG